ncbi:hypothetical protein [Wenyingzhuangia aestuarii]|uniref:hypothetical protein n=1 Tax=Wenyingzhuangia aestuarii TaxID=1647582 RepID=UPI00143C5D2F|nr:hypothetical protein [Wenyingzhuangia aestuarii]NJB82058.1 hypothetical protein [Wenyingzhuangia aestuarii]
MKKNKLKQLFFVVLLCTFFVNNGYSQYGEVDDGIDLGQDEYGHDWFVNNHGDITESWVDEDGVLNLVNHGSHYNSGGDTYDPCEGLTDCQCYGTCDPEPNPEPPIDCPSGDCEGGGSNGNEGTSNEGTNDESTNESQIINDDCNNKRSLFDAIMGTLGGALEVGTGVLTEPVSLGTSTILIVDGSYRVIANGADVIAIIGHYDYDIPNNLGALLGSALDFLTRTDSNDHLHEDVLGYANDAYTFVATGGTVGNAKTLAAAVEKGNVIMGTAAVANTAVFLNDLDNLDEIINEDCQ